MIPERPGGTEGWAEADLARLVTRDSMIGVRRAAEPAELEAGAEGAAAAPPGSQAGPSAAAGAAPAAKLTG